MHAWNSLALLQSSQEKARLKVKKKEKKKEYPKIHQVILHPLMVPSRGMYRRVGTDPSCHLSGGKCLGQVQSPCNAWQCAGGKKRQGPFYWHWHCPWSPLGLVVVHPGTLLLGMPRPPLFCWTQPTGCQACHGRLLPCTAQLER